MDAVIGEVFSTEEEARRIIEEARSKASALTSEAAKTAESEISAAKQRLAAESAAILKATEERLRERTQAELDRARAEAADAPEARRDFVEQVAARVADILMRPESGLKDPS